MKLHAVSLDELTIEDERSVAHLEIYRRLKQSLRRSGHRFLIPVDGAAGAASGAVRWDRVLFLNLTYWGGGADVLCDDHLTADEVGHVAWHGIVGRELARAVVGPAGQQSQPTRVSCDALFFSESIASAFDLYLLGYLLRDAPDSDFITTQVPLMAERAQDAGLSGIAFAALVEEIAREPERAFEDLRTLLFDAAKVLFQCRGVLEANQALGAFAHHRFEPLLHHFELSNWILYARAYGASIPGPDPVVARWDETLRLSPCAIDWLADHWIDADLPSDRRAP